MTIKNEIKSDKCENYNLTGNEENSILQMTKTFLADLNKIEIESKIISMPIAQLAALGSSVSTLIPTLRTVTETTTIDTQELGLYKLANVAVGDTLKVAKNGKFWGAFNTAEGKSKFAQLQSTDPITINGSTVLPIDPATILMAFALFSIEQQLNCIEEIGKEILSFLEVEKESEIEADVEMLIDIISKYKFNWNNKHFVESYHKLVLDIQRNARKNLNFYTKRIAKEIRNNKLFVVQGKVNGKLNDMVKNFKYYRLTIYIFSLSCLIEILLSGNFQEENILYNKEEIEKLSLNYRNIFNECSLYLEKLIKSSVDVAVIKGTGETINTIGKFLGDVPVLKEIPIDEFLQENGKKLKKNASGKEKDVLKSFSEISNPGIKILTDRMDDLVKIYGRTKNIYFDNDNIYLIE